MGVYEGGSAAAVATLPFIAIMICVFWCCPESCP